MEAEMVATELAVGGTLGEDGRYRLERMLGTGGMASVWLAEDTRLARSVAVKVLADSLALDASYVSRFRREARVAAQLSHPNLVNVYDFSAAPRPYLAMEYVPGATLADLLHGRRRAAWDPEVVLRELMCALAHVHGAGIIHRDVKPGNVLIGHDGHIRLTDFGIARPSGAERLTSTGLVIGTARYLAPEVLRGEEPDERSDLYASGVLLRDMLRNGGSPHLRSLADRLSDEDPRHRPASADEVLELLDGPQTAPTAAMPSASVFRARPQVPRPTALAAAIAAVLAIVIVVLALSGGSGGSRSNTPARASVPAANAPLASQLDYLERAVSHARR
jgi:serine/threonine protein kinase